MNAHAKRSPIPSAQALGLPDIQARPDLRGLALDAVGVKGLRHPLNVQGRRGSQPTVATLDMTVGLSAASKGTHMSRFIEVLEARPDIAGQAGLRTLVYDMLARLGASSGCIEMSFPYFVRKSAPVSGTSSLLDYDVTWRGEVDARGTYRYRMRVTVPVTSLCPCSKEISSYGAHNQRSLIAIEAELDAEMAIEELIAIAERNASCEVYGLLKRPDEKYVTERAYDNPKFVEDLVRDVALALQAEPRVGAYRIEAENFESIHNHSAYARIERPAAFGQTAP
ncbi:GTP cyclohydrolase FolE2 [Candidimonas humi]|uniref:GTP cyclohydrolase FolE2 n=1 Tax=Candidimonas humi TaxID=683355 RepID=A0ABV8NXI0_9BURK|nr:GTP cyclohydrolase FolE2 [Candidimonas humi]MBV6304971.1 GTP cyclohydrolase FolE2 [Candidimonas humi]